jgi:hypothetical protein
MCISIIYKIRKAFDFIRIVQNLYFLFHNVRYMNILKCLSSKMYYTIYIYSINYYMINRTSILVDFYTLRAGPKIYLM